MQDLKVKPNVKQKRTVMIEESRAFQSKEAFTLQINVNEWVTRKKRRIGEYFSIWCEGIENKEEKR